ncbi:PqqD family protein [Sphingobacterium ginsenosidimutans]|uniref:PqqD family protein n=1 Tax=Sphingobacterium ginsenosidimutans TaxID=687845 RepID=A0ABP7ZQS4_9SPHI
MKEYMEFRTDFLVRCINGTYYVVDPGDGPLDISQVFTLSESTAFLFTTFRGRKFTVSCLEEAMGQEYESDSAIIKQDVAKLVSFLEGHKFLKD